MEVRHVELERSLKILIADDSNSDRLLLKTIVQNQGHTVIVAADGVEALDAFTREKPDIVLLDALMPRMDGFEAAERIKSMSGTDFVPVIFLTSLKEADSLALCLEAGGDDFLTKPYNSIILKAKINAFSRMLRMHKTLQMQRDQIAANHEHLIQEQEIAKRVFDKVAHAGCLHVNNIKYKLSPLAVFNGDVLLAAVRPSGNMFVLLGDFTGHGLAAAIGAMPLAQTFYSMAAKGFGIREVLAEINNKLKEILPVGVFCCASMIDLDMRAKKVEIWNGGLPDCYLYSAASGQLTLLKSSHLPLGVLNSKDFKGNTTVHEMHDGDRLFMWSDGILEAVNGDGEMFGEARLRALFENVDDPSALFARINETVSEFIGDEQPADDLSFVEVTMVDQNDFEGTNELPVKKAHQGPSDWTMTYIARPDTLREFNPLPMLLQILMDIPGLRPHSGQIYTVLAELYSNALEHGILGLSSAEKVSSVGFAQYYHERSRRLAALTEGYVRFDLDYCGDSRSGRLIIRVEDSGDGFDHHGFFETACMSDGYSGRGVPLLWRICDRVEFLGKGNTVEVEFGWRYAAGRQFGFNQE
jgi:DNA-binding response OmpR family regulator